MMAQILKRWIVPLVVAVFVLAIYSVTPVSATAVPTRQPTKDQVDLYTAAATAMCPAMTNRPALDPALLASVHYIESSLGTSDLPGVKSGQNSKGAMGPMQFLQGTWKQYNVLAPGNPMPPNVYDEKDAVYSAANYLCHLGAATVDKAKLRNAIYGYNHSNSYVDDVLNDAAYYDGLFPSQTTSVASVMGIQTGPTNLVTSTSTTGNNDIVGALTCDLNPLCVAFKAISGIGYSIAYAFMTPVIAGWNSMMVGPDNITGSMSIGPINIDTSGIRDVVVNVSYLRIALPATGLLVAIAVVIAWFSGRATHELQRIVFFLAGAVIIGALELVIVGLLLEVDNLLVSAFAATGVFELSHLAAYQSFNMQNPITLNDINAVEMSIALSWLGCFIGFEMLFTLFLYGVRILFIIVLLAWGPIALALGIVPQTRNLTLAWAHSMFIWIFVKAFNAFIFFVLAVAIRVTSGVPLVNGGIVFILGLFLLISPLWLIYWSWSHRSSIVQKVELGAVIASVSSLGQKAIRRMAQSA